MSNNNGNKRNQIKNCYYWLGNNWVRNLVQSHAVHGLLKGATKSEELHNYRKIKTHVLHRRQKKGLVLEHNYKPVESRLQHCCTSASIQTKSEEATWDM